METFILYAMKYIKQIIFWILVMVLPAIAGDRLVDELFASYDEVETVSCEVRRTSRMKGDKIKSLSRVHYQKPDRIHVDSTAPIERRHVADGERLYYYVEGDAKGFSRPIEELDDEWLHSLRKVPGTAMNHLYEIGDAEEDKLPATDDYPIRRGYDVEKVYIVLSLGEQERLQMVEYYQSPDMEKRVLKSDYSNFKEVLPDVWIPCRHETDLKLPGIEKQETVQFLNLKVNEPIAQGLFNPSTYFEDVEFVDNFEEIYK